MRVCDSLGVEVELRDPEELGDPLWLGVPVSLLDIDCERLCVSLDVRVVLAVMLWLEVGE